MVIIRSFRVDEISGGGDSSPAAKE